MYIIFRNEARSLQSVKVPLGTLRAVSLHQWTWLGMLYYTKYIFVRTLPARFLVRSRATCVWNSEKSLSVLYGLRFMACKLGRTWLFPSIPPLADEDAPENPGFVSSLCFLGLISICWSSCPSSEAVSLSVSRTHLVFLPQYRGRTKLAEMSVFFLL